MDNTGSFFCNYLDSNLFAEFRARNALSEQERGGVGLYCVIEGLLPGFHSHLKFMVTKPNISRWSACHRYCFDGTLDIEKVS
jgi:hypothetical protein